MIKCIIVEDERLAQNVIVSHLKNIENFELAGICNNALEAKEMLKQQPVDLVFLDIQLPSMTGLHFLKTLQHPPLVILTTAYAEYAAESYDLNVVDYLLKPISSERFAKATDKIIERHIHKKSTAENASDHIFIKSDGKFFKTNFSEIVYIEAMKDYIKIFTENNKLIMHQTMNEMERTLPAKQFFRVHKSYIVSLSHIKTINGNTIETGNAIIPIGMNYKEKVMQLVGRKSS